MEDGDGYQRKKLKDYWVIKMQRSDNKWAFTANSYKHFDKLTDGEQYTLCKWINDNFIKTKTPNNRHTSYGLKHIFENTVDGFYITNGQFKGAMCNCGFKPKNKNDLNWIFYISQKSPAIKNR